MHFKRKGDFVPAGDGTLLMNGEWYDSQEDADDEDTRGWLIDQIRLPISNAKHATVELLEDAIAKRADELAPARAAELADRSLDDDLPDDVKQVFGRNRVVDANAVRQRAADRRAGRGGRA